MPYYIAEPGTTADCPTWATVKETNGSIDVLGCHQYKQDAIDQAIAISLSEGDETLYKGEWSRRNDEGEQIIISDLDDTLIHAGERMNDVYEFLEAMDRPVFIVTGRPESDREATIMELEAADIDYAQLIMNPGSSAESNEYKKATAQTLLETYNVILAVENNPDARAGYAELGLEVIDPAEIKPQEEEPMSEDQPMQEASPEGRQTASKIETRVASQAFELREEGDGMTFTGYAALWDSPSQPLPFTERIQRGAFKRSLQSRNDIKLLWNHDTGSILGSTRAGTLTLTEDDRGLRATAKFPNTTLGRDTAELIRTGNVDSMSFGFSVPDGGDKWSQDGSERTLLSVRIHEVSLVAFPAYTSTAGTVSVRAYSVVAQRAEVDAEELASAISAIEEGKELTLDQASLIRKVVDRISPEQPKPEGDALMLALKKKKLEMLEKTNGN
jgi:HK97 family phage prohead protease